MENRQINSIDEYISNFPDNIKGVLEAIRQVIKQSAPEAYEAISYGMPTFKLNGNLVHFATHKNHIGFYPTPSAITAFKKELSSYETSKGAIRFLVDKPIPYTLIEKMVKFRVNEVLSNDN